MPPKQRVLVLGANGMLGHKLVEVLRANSEIDLHALSRTDLDVTRGAAAIDAALQSVRPEVVINAIGAIKQRDLYSQMDDTFFLNGVLPHLLAQLTSKIDCRVIHFSTDCVFRGDRGNYTEADKPDVEDLYGRSKAIGEIDYGRHLTIRTSIVGFERSGHLGLLGWFLKQKPGSTLKGYTHAIYSGLPTVTLAKLVAWLIVERPDLRGLYHVASEPIDKFTLLARLNEALGLQHTMVPSDELRMDRSLDDTRFREATGTKRPDWDSLIAELVTDFHAGPYPQIYELLYA